jgi:hypothetical protein
MITIKIFEKFISMRVLDETIDAISKYAQKNGPFCGQLCVLGLSMCYIGTAANTKVLSDNGHSVGTILLRNGILVCLSAFAYARYHKMSLWVFSPPAPPGTQDTLILRGIVGTGSVYLFLFASSMLPLYLPGFFSPRNKIQPTL